MHSYHVEYFTTGFFSGTLNAEKLKKRLNELGLDGWQLERTIHERKRLFIFFSREVHVLIFRHVTANPQADLLRQLLRAYGHEPAV